MLTRILAVALIAAVTWGGIHAVRANRLKAETVALRAENATLEREATGNAEISTATETLHTREVIYRDIQTQADRDARNAPDAESPLPDERLARHLRNDERVCLDATFSCTALDAPLSGAGAVSPDDASR